ncbi:MAG: hypothetical protein ACPHN2_04720 [Sinimarinibacterium flocculans]|uniref:hypothetical protein n=1 Tax=Sinimarinibacterium flocculans TaxID=985250 RepID=UPI003C51CDE8
MLRDINDVRRTNANWICANKFGGDRKQMADALDVSGAYLGRILNEGVSQPRNIGDDVARKIEEVGGMPTNWLDHDYERLPPGLEPLLERYKRSDPETQAMIRLALDDPDAPLPAAMRESLKTMIQAVRMAIASQIKP